MLDALLISHGHEVVIRTRAEAARRSGSSSDKPQLGSDIPLFLDRLGTALRGSLPPAPEVDLGAARHGGELFQEGFSVSQVVHCYGDVGQVLLQLALEMDITIPADQLCILNACLHGAIASALTEYERQREEVSSRQETERLGAIAHELRNSLGTALLAFASMKRGLVVPGRSTGDLLNQSLGRLRHIVDHSLSEVRSESSGFFQRASL